ncbi:MAG TPA: hypothetical protein VHC96_08685 [Puia sp.]|nr:hypothetical protein [Puia sp.]
MKITPLVLIPLILLSCHGPSSDLSHPSDSTTAAATKATDSGKNALDAGQSGGRDTVQPARVDTPSTPMIAKNWIGDWNYEGMFGGGGLKIDNIKGNTFTFSMEANDGGGSGELEGSAKLQGYHALYTKKEYGGACRIEFTFEGDSISVDQQEGNCGAGAGVYYSGVYYKHPPKRPEETLLSLGMLDNEAQDKKFRDLVGDDYKLFVESSQLVFEKQKDKDSLGAVVHQAGVKHMFTEMENIILINDHQDIWAAVIHGDSVNYYTSRADYKHRVPKTIDSWRENFNEKPIVFK